MDTIKSQLEILSENSQGSVNYVSWRFKLDLTLKSKKLFAIATGIEKKPAGLETEAKVIEWVEKDINTQAIIGLNVDSNIAYKISKCTSSKQMLEKLNLLYAKKSELTIEGLQRKFFNYQYDVSKSAVENCMIIQQFADDLKAEGEDVKDSWVMTRVLGTLPHKLHHFRVAWDNVSSTEKSIDLLMERLRLEEDRLNESKSSSQNALTTKQKKKGQRTNSNTPETLNVECFKCGQKGHFKNDCKNKPCAKYIAYCKENYSCNSCNQKGHFAKECPKGNTSQDSNQKQDSKKTNRRVLITIGLSTTEVNNAKTSTECKDVWYQDCGATQHMSFHREWMTNYIALKKTSDVMIGDATILEGVGIGDVELKAYDGQDWNKVVLKDVLYVPELTFNLFSVTQLLDKGYVQTANANQSIFLTPVDEEVVVIARRVGKLFTMMFRQESDDKCLLTLSIKTWHERLAHQNIKYVRDFLRKTGVVYNDDWNNYVCEGCVYGKQHRISHPRNEKTAENVLDLVHVDLGEMNVPSLGGAKYFLLFKDDYSHFRTVYFLETKDEAVSRLHAFVKLTENQFGRSLKKLMSDNGKEIKNNSIRQILEKFGVFHLKSNVYTPQQNGRIEREMRTVVEAARSIIHSKGLSEDLWAEAINYAVFTLNQTGISTVKDKSPAEIWFGRRVSINKLKSFGCTCYVLIPDHKRGKMDKKSRKGIFVGYDLDSPCYRIYLPEENDVVSSDNVVFDEEIKSRRGSSVETYEHPSERNDIESDAETPDESITDESFHDVIEASDNSSEDSSESKTRPRNLRDRRNLRKPAKFADYKLSSDEDTVLIGEVNDIPVDEALKDKQWHKAMTEEFESLTNMQTWKLVELPENVKPLSCRWILREKQDGRLKARLVARGYQQTKGIDYTEIFSPVARHASIRLVLSIVASKKMKLKTFDVKTAFLYGELEEEIYMTQPEGFHDGTDRICKLSKSIYGLKQAPKNWNKKVSSFLKTLNFKNTDDDPCIYYNKNRSMLMVLFVDDGLIAGTNEEDILNILKKINRKFKITYDLKLQKQLTYLGMQIKIEPEGIFVSQSKYTKRIIKRFDFDMCNRATTPIEKGMIANEENFLNDEALTKSVPYREALGSLLYLATISRPDISFAVNYLSRFCNKPMKSHWKMMKRIFQYLKGNQNLGIFFNGEDSLTAYTDSDYGGDTRTGHSTSGVLIIRGGPIVWFTQKQRLVATSTAEAEYRAAVSSIDDICWIRRIGSELKILNLTNPTKLCVDNQSAIHMLENAYEGKVMKGKKHIDIPRKFIQEHIGKTIDVMHVKSSDQLADILTKPLSRRLFESLRSKIIKEEC